MDIWLFCIVSRSRSRSRSRSGSAASNRSGSPIRKKRAVLSDSEDEGMNFSTIFTIISPRFLNQIGFFFIVKGGAVSQALKRAKILDSDHEDEPAEVPVEGNQISAGLIDAGESSDEGVRNDDDNQGYISFSWHRLHISKITEYYSMFQE